MNTHKLRRAWTAAAVFALVAVPTAVVMTASAFTDTAPTTIVANTANEAINFATVTQPAAALLTADPAVDKGVSTITNVISSAPIAATVTLLASLFAIMVFAPSALRRRGRLQAITAHSLHDMSIAPAHQGTRWTTRDDKQLTAMLKSTFGIDVGAKINGHGFALTGAT